MQAIISAGLVMRVIFCAVRLAYEEEEAGRYKKRIKNSLIILVIAQLIFPLKELLITYLGEGYCGGHHGRQNHHTLRAYYGAGVFSRLRKP